MNEQKTNELARAGEQRGAAPDARIGEDFEAERTEIEALLADPSRDEAATGDLRSKLEDLKERVPAHRQEEFGSFFRGVEERLEAGAPTGEMGSPSALDTSDAVDIIAAPTGGRQP